MPVVLDELFETEADPGTEILLPVVMLFTFNVLESVKLKIVDVYA